MANWQRTRLCTTQLKGQAVSTLVTPSYSAPGNTEQTFVFLHGPSLPVPTAGCPPPLPPPPRSLFAHSRLRKGLTDLCPAQQAPNILIVEHTALPETQPWSHRYRGWRIAQGETMYP